MENLKKLRCVFETIPGLFGDQFLVMLNEVHYLNGAISPPELSRGVRRRRSTARSVSEPAVEMGPS